MPVICLDPGHPSETSAGNTTLNGLREVEVVYDVAMALKPILERDLGARVVLTRDFRSAGGRTVTNRRRAEIANESQADLFLRLHCDAGPGHGFAVYYPDRPGTVGGVTGPPADIRAHSERAARAMHSGMASKLVGVLDDNGVKGDSATTVGRRQGALTGSIHARVPAVTVEMLFLTNRDDARFIAAKAGRDRMARALAEGVRRVLALPVDSR